MFCKHDLEKKKKTFLSHFLILKVLQIYFWLFKSRNTTLPYIDSMFLYQKAK